MYLNQLLFDAIFDESCNREEVKGKNEEDMKLY